MKEGSLHSIICGLDYDTGADVHLGVGIMALGMEYFGGPYKVPNLESKGRCIYTNSPIGGAFRGGGAAQVSFALEGMMDRLAGAFGMAPWNCGSRTLFTGVTKTVRM